MPSKLRQVVPHAVMLAMAAWLYWQATRIDADTGGRIGPAAWPKAVIVVMALLCAYEIAKRLLSRGEFTARGLLETHRPGEEAEAPAPETLAAHPWKLAGGIALVVAYVVLVPYAGFFIATALFLAVFPWVGGLRRPVLSAVLGAGGSLLLVVVFMRIAYISLPLGEGAFRALSIALLRALGVT